MTSSTGLGAGFRTALIIITIAAGGFATVATIVAFFGNVWWVFDLFANFRWHLAWIALLSAIVYALTAQGAATLVFVIAAVVNSFVLAPLWLGAQPDGTGEDGVTIVSVDMFGGSDDEEASLRWLFDSGADLIVASGVSGDRLAPLLDEGSPYQPIVTPPGNRSGIAIIGRGPYTVETRTTESQDEPVHIVSVPSGDDTIDVVTAWGQIASDSQRAAELDERLDLIAEIVDDRDDPMVVVGNLGATRWTAGMRSLLSTTGLRDATEGGGYLATWPVSGLPIVGGWIGIPIDVVLMTPDVTPFELSTGPDIGVHHLPVTVVAGPVDDLT